MTLRALASGLCVATAVLGAVAGSVAFVLAGVFGVWVAGRSGA